MAATQNKVESYYLDPTFERFVVYYACSSPSFYGRIGHALDPDALVDDSAKLAVQAAQAIFAENGKGSSAPFIVVQRIRRWTREGRTTIDQVHAVNALFEAVEDGSVLPTEGSIAEELAPILKRRIQRTAVDAAIEEYQAKGDFSRVREAIQMADSIGLVDQSPGTSTFRGTGGVEAIEAAASMEYLSTGIFELDTELDGGLARGQMGIVVGGPGDGKSMFLSHVCAAGVRAGLCAAYATLELPDRIVHARLMANVSGLPINEVLGNARNAHVICARIGLKGHEVVKFFTPQATTVEDIRKWMEDAAKAMGRPVDLLVVDYADKLISLRKDDSSYTAMRDVYEGLRLFAVERNMWCWTASQSKAKGKDKGSKHNRDVESLADSMHKGRVADLVVTLNVNDDGNEVTMFVAKNRTGKSRFAIGPLPTDFALGRMVVA